MAADASKKREEEIRALSRAPDNKYCFDCGKQGPQFNVVIDLSVFVCQDCSGLHRAYGHKSKSVSMTAFTEPEVAALREGGNKKAAKKWLAKFSKDKFTKDLKEPANLKEYMDLCYRDKKWYAEDGDDDGDERKAEKKEKKKKEKAATAVQSADDLLDSLPPPPPPPPPPSTAHDDDDPFGAPTPVVVAPVKKAAAPVAAATEDFFGLGSSAPAPAATAATTASPNPAIADALAVHLRGVMKQHHLDFAALWSAHLLPALKQLPGFDSGLLGPTRGHHTRNSSVNPFLAASAAEALTSPPRAAATAGGNPFSPSAFEDSAPAVVSSGNPFSPMAASAVSGAPTAATAASAGAEDIFGASVSGGHRKTGTLDLATAFAAGVAKVVAPVDDLFGGSASGSGGVSFAPAPALAPVAAPLMDGMFGVPAPAKREDPLAALAEPTSLAARRSGFADRLNVGVGLGAAPSAYAAMATAPVLSNPMSVNPNNIFAGAAFGGAADSNFYRPQNAPAPQLLSASSAGQYAAQNAFDSFGYSAASQQAPVGQPSYQVQQQQQQQMPMYAQTQQQPQQQFGQQFGQSQYGQTHFGGPAQMHQQQLMPQYAGGMQQQQPPAWAPQSSPAIAGYGMQQPAFPAQQQQQSPAMSGMPPMHAQQMQHIQMPQQMQYGGNPIAQQQQQQQPFGVVTSAQVAAPPAPAPSKPSPFDVFGSGL